MVETVETFEGIGMSAYIRDNDTPYRVAWRREKSSATRATATT